MKAAGVRTRDGLQRSVRVVRRALDQPDGGSGRCNRSAGGLKVLPSRALAGLHFRWMAGLPDPEVTRSVVAQKTRFE